MNRKLIIGLFFLLGCLGLYEGLNSLLSSQEATATDRAGVTVRSSKSEESTGWLFIFLAIPAFAIPILGERGLIPYDYYDSPRAVQARTNLIVGAIVLPAIVTLGLAATPEECSAGLNCRVLATALIGYLLYMLYWFYVWRNQP